MKEVTKQAEVKTAYSQVLPTPIGFSYTYEELQKGDTIPEKEVPDADDLLQFVNTKRNSAARAKAQNEALENAGIKKPSLEDADYRLKQMVKILTATGTSEADAEVQARAVLGM